MSIILHIAETVVFPATFVLAISKFEALYLYSKAGDM